jgi:hypothetical protein
MPVSTIIFLYGISILAGAVLVVYGLSQNGVKKAAAPDAGVSGAPNDLDPATLDVIELRFMDEEAERATPQSETPKPETPKRKRKRFTSIVEDEPGTPPKPSTSLSHILKAPLRMFDRLTRRPVRNGLARPLTSKLHLDAKDVDEAESAGDSAPPSDGK